jgi:hypothetical protein
MRQNSMTWNCDSIGLPRPEIPLLITRTELMTTLVRQWLGSIQVIHGWKLGALEVAPR